MILIDRTIVSDELLEKEFVCNLEKCKGACCVEGESGAPLEKDELMIVEEVYEKIKPFMTEKGIAAVEKYGTHVIDADGDHVTTLVAPNKECAYAIFENGIAQCSFEKAYNRGVINFRKPISCHLYPVRITVHKEYDAVNYDKWEVCDPACSLGKTLGVPVYKFVKDALIRKYGQAWYDQLNGAAEFAASNEANENLPLF